MQLFKYPFIIFMSTGTLYLSLQESATVSKGESQAQFHHGQCHSQAEQSPRRQIALPLVLLCFQFSSCCANMAAIIFLPSMNLTHLYNYFYIFCIDTLDFYCLIHWRFI